MNPVCWGRGRVWRMLLLLLAAGLMPMSLLAQTPDDKPLIRVQLNWKHQYEFAAFYAALDKGFYDQLGIRVQIIEGGPGIHALEEVLGGRADVTVSTSGLVVERAKGKPVVALAALMQHSPIALLALRQPGLESVHDLAHQSIAVDDHNRDEIEAYLLASGLSRDKLNFIAQTDWTLASLHTGINAAKVVYTINETFLIRHEAQRYLLLLPRSAGIDLFGNVLATTEAHLADKESALLAFREATLQGLRYALDYPEEITDLILAQYNTQNKSREHLLYEAAQIRELTRPDLVEPGYMSEGRWRYVVDVYVGLGKIPASFSLQGFMYTPDAPVRLPVWVWLVLVSSLLALILLVWLNRYLQGYNQRLQREVVQRQQAQAALAASEATYRELVNNANVIILRIDFDGRVTYFNPFAERFFGFTQQEILGRHVVGSIVPAIETGTRRDLSAMVDVILAQPDNYQINENENMTKDGRRVWIHWINRVLFDAIGQPTGVLSIGHDISERREHEEKIHKLAFYDVLTGLPNRRLMLDRLRQAVLQHQRNGHYGALMFIDLDHFKLLNDTQGHQMGDALLTHVAERLLQTVRQGDSVARLGGDEFIVMLEDLGEDVVAAVAEAEGLAVRLLDVLGQPYDLNGLLYHLTCSIGIALFRDQQSDVDELLKRADLAMYEAKSAGRNQLRFFDPNMQVMVDVQARLLTELRQAVQQNEFFLVYQPQVDSQGRVCGVEALMRWRHPQQGELSPYHFIALLEETAMIQPVGMQLLAQACDQLAQWQQQPATADWTLSVNISVLQFQQEGFVEALAALIARSQIRAQGLVLEITESLFMQQLDAVLDKMHRLRALGVRFSIDDFGTGYSSLAYLKRLPLDELKIDRSFMTDLEHDENAQAIVQIFVQLARLLRLTVVAEGVETPQQWAFLQEMDCQLYQGYLFARPMTAQALEETFLHRE